MTELNNDQSGFTLLEVLVALTIFAIGLLGIAGVQVRSIDFNSGSNTRTIATGIAQGVLEQVMTRSATDNIFKSDSPVMDFDLDPDPAKSALTVEGGGDYSATWVVRANTPTANVAQVTVTVTGPKQRSVSLEDFKRVY